MSEDGSANIEFSFLRGKSDGLAREYIKTHEGAVGKVRVSLTEVLNVPNIAFLLGAGCSSCMRTVKGTDGVEDLVELGIPTMGPMASGFLPGGLSGADAAYLKTLGIDIGDCAYTTNLERLMEVLYAQRFVLERGKQAAHLRTVLGIIRKIQAHILHLCTGGQFASGDSTVQDIYRAFYRKLVYRDRSLPRPWVFTTNYDLFSERALDGLGISFCNGFSGVIDRTFNPATFKYAPAEQLDVASRKWMAVDNHVYLCKLHGSINWVQDRNAGIHGIREVQPPTTGTQGEVMIFPTPLKQHATLASPYTDLFREFQSRIVREQTVLVTLGYGFGDDHIDAIIHQALTVPTFRLVVFGSPDVPGIAKLVALDDPRIWVVSGQTPDGRRVHYFDYIVERFLPDLPGERIDQSVQHVVDLIRRGLEKAGALEDPR